MLAISEMPLFGEYSVPNAYLGMSSKLWFGVHGIFSVN